MILVVNWFGIQVIWLSIDVWFKWFWLSIDLKFKWFVCQSIWDSNELAVSRFEIQMSWLSIDLRFKWFGCQMIWGSSDLVVNWCVVQMILSNETFLRDFLQKRFFDAQKPSVLCETSFKNQALKLKNEAFVRDFLQKSNFEAQKRSFCARLPSKIKLWRSKTKHFYETSFKNDMLTRHLTSEFQYVLTIFKWMLQKYCTCHEKVEPGHTNSCNCHAKWSLQSNTSVTWNLQPFHGFCAGGFKHRHRKARNPCACHTKRIVSDPLQIHHACQRFCNPHELLRLPRILQPVEIPAPATRKPFWTSKNVPNPQFLTILTSKSLSRAGMVQILVSSTSKSAPNPRRFNDFDFRIALARRRGANFAKLNFKKCSEPTAF